MMGFMGTSRVNCRFVPVAALGSSIVSAENVSGLLAGIVAGLKETPARTNGRLVSDGSRTTLPAIVDEATGASTGFTTSGWPPVAVAVVRRKPGVGGATEVKSAEREVEVNFSGRDGRAGRPNEPVVGRNEDF